MSRTRIAGHEIDRLTPRDAVDRIVAFAHTRDRHVVVTPNVDHVLRLRKRSHCRSAYATASLVLTDGMPLVWVSRLGNTPLQGGARCRRRSGRTRCWRRPSAKTARFSFSAPCRRRSSLRSGVARSIFAP